MEKPKSKLKKSSLKSGLNRKAREFKPKARAAMPPPPPPVANQAPVACDTGGGKFYKGVLPGQAPSRPMPSAFPPGMEVKFENGKLVIPDAVPTGLRKIIEQAQEEGKFDDMIMASMGQSRPAPAEDDYDLSPEEEAMAQQFLAEQQAMEPCPFFLQGNCKFGSKCDMFHPNGMDEITGDIDFEGDQECSICNEMILANSKQFGLLDGCDHAF